MKKDPRVYLAQIVERIDRILRYPDEGKDAFLRDLVIQDAVIRNFEVIGEAAKRIPVEYRDATPHDSMERTDKFKGCADSSI